MQIGASAITPYGMQSNATTAMSAQAGARAYAEMTPVAPVSEILRGQRGEAWIDASWTEAPERPAQIDPYETGETDGAVAFAAQTLGQTAEPHYAAPAAHQLGCAAYRAAQGGQGEFRRGDMGIDLVA